MASETAKLFEPSKPVNAAALRKPGVVGLVGAGGYPPLVSVCKLLACTEVEWVKGSAGVRCAVEGEVKNLIKGGQVAVHLAVFDNEVGGVGGWPTHEGSSEVEVKVNDRLLRFALDEDSHTIPGQLYLSVPPETFGSDKVLDVSLRQRHQPRDYPSDKPWAHIPIILVLLVKHLEAVDLQQEYPKIPPAPCLPPDDVSIVADISFIDPMSLTKIAPPMVRGRSCTHLQCFDLNMWLVMGRTRGAAIHKWICPVCGEKLSWGDLVRDVAMEKYCTEHPDVETLVGVDMGKWGTGDWVAEKVVKASADVSSDEKVAVSKRRGQQKKATTTGGGSAKRRKPAEKQPAAAAGEMNHFTTFPEYVRLASQLTILIERKEYSELGDILTDLAALPPGRAKVEWLNDSGIIRQVKWLQTAKVPDISASAAGLMKKWIAYQLQAGSDAKQDRVQPWAAEQAEIKKRPVVTHQGVPYELGDSQMCKMVQCPLYKMYYRPSPDPTDTVPIPSEVDQYNTINGHWIADRLLGICFEMTTGKRPREEPTPQPAAAQQPGYPPQYYYPPAYQAPYPPYSYPYPPQGAPS